MSSSKQGTEMIPLLPRYGAAPRVSVQKQQQPRRPWFPAETWRRVAIALLAVVAVCGVVLGFSWKARAVARMYVALNPMDAGCMTDLLVGWDDVETKLEAGAEAQNVAKAELTAKLIALATSDWEGYFYDSSPADAGVVFTDDDGQQYEAGQQYTLTGTGGIADLVAIFGNLQAAGVLVAAQTDQELLDVAEADAAEASLVCDNIEPTDENLFLAEVAYTWSVTVNGAEEDWAIDVLTYDEKSADDGTCRCKCFVITIANGDIDTA